MVHFTGPGAIPQETVPEEVPPERTKLELLKEKWDRAERMDYCPHSDGVFWTLMISLLLGGLIVTALAGFNKATLIALAVCGVIFLMLGGGFFANRYVMYRRRVTKEAYEEELRRTALQP